MFPSQITGKSWAAVGAVALGIFALMTSELLPVGLLTPIGSGMGVSEGAAGLMLTVPGLVAAASAPVVTVTAARIDRRTLLAALVALMAVADLVCAAAPHYAVLLAARVAIGVSVGGFWAIAGGLAVRLVPARHVARATAIVFGGVSTASVAGVPAGTLIGDLGGWRAAFAAVGVLGLVALVGTGRVAAFNLSIALGALAGGALVDATTTTGVLWAAGLLALLAATAVSASRRSLPA